MSEAKLANCSRLSEVMDISHDSVNRFLLREAYEPKDLFDEAKRLLNLVGGTLSVDDSVLDKPYSHHMELVAYFWSGKHHRVVKGLNLVTLYYTDPQGRHLPVDFRVYDKADGKTKNDYFLDMLSEVLEWGLKPAFSTGDSWYSCIKNLKTIKNHSMGFMFAVESNRLVSTSKGSWVQVQQLDIPDNGQVVWLRDFGEVKLFRTRLKNQMRHYIVLLSNVDSYPAFDKDRFQKLHCQHWLIEQYHRAIKQVCNIERFQVRRKVPILNHIFAALCSYVHLQKMQMNQSIINAYHLQLNLYKNAAAEFIRDFMIDKNHLNPQFVHSINA